MCRLFGFRGSHPTKVDCGLIDAQNSLLRQSEDDARGFANPDGWGIGLVRDGEAECEREVGPAFGSDEYRRDAADAEAVTVLAHVRRATVGSPAPENTHPFRRGASMLAHNGHIAGFGQIRERMLAEMTASQRQSLRGDTDSEHFLHLLLSRWDEAGASGEDADRPARMRRVLKRTAREVVEWAEAPAAEGVPSSAGAVAAGAGTGGAGAVPGRGSDRTALNVLWTVEEDLVGTRLGRTLWYVERDEPHVCSVCGRPHPGDAPEDYRAVVLASEPITEEEWEPVPEGSAFAVGPDFRLRTEPLGV